MLNKVSLIALRTIVAKEVEFIFNSWSQTLLPAVTTSMLYFLVFGNILGNRFGLMHGVSYAQYVAPGLIMMVVINNAYGQVSGNYFVYKFQRVVDELLIAPISVHIILWGYVLGGIIRSFLTGILVTAVAMAFTHVVMQHVFFILGMFFLSGLLFSLAGLLNGLAAKKFNDIMFIPTFVLTPLIYLGGVFYAVNLLPGIWHYLSLFNPIFYLINAFRFAMIGYSEVNLLPTLAIILGFILALYAIVIYMLRQRIGVRF